MHLLHNWSSTASCFSKLTVFIHAVLYCLQIRMKKDINLENARIFASNAVLWRTKMGTACWSLRSGSNLRIRLKNLTEKYTHKRMGKINVIGKSLSFSI